MNEFQSQYSSFDLNTTLKYNIIKNYSNFNINNLKNTIINDNILLQFINKIYDTIYIKRLESKHLKSSDPKKFKKLIHPINTFLKNKNLAQIFQLKKSNKTISNIYDSIYNTHINKYVTETNESTTVDDIKIPTFKTKKQDSEQINNEIIDYLKDIYTIFLLQNHINDQFIDIILYTVSILFFNFYNKNLEDIESNIKNIQNFFDKIINKLIHKIYTSNILYLDDLILKVKTPYSDFVKIDNIDSNIFNTNKLLEKHLNKTWNIIIKKEPQKFDDEYKDKKVPIIKILNDENIIKSSNTIIISIIKDFNKTKSKQTILSKLTKIDYTSFYIKNNISSNLLSIFKNLSDTPLFNDNISIVNTIETNKPEFSNLNIFTKKNNNFKYSFTSFTNTNSVYQNSQLSIFNQYLQHLLLYVYEPQDINSNNIPEFYNKKRLFYLNEDNLEYCYYTNYSKHHIINNILKLDQSSILSIYNKSIQSKNYILNHTNYINNNQIDKEPFTGLNSLFNNLNYKLTSDNTTLLYKFITLYIKDFEYSKPPLWNIQMKFYSDPVHYSIVFINLYKEGFVEFINQTNTIYKDTLLSIIDSIKPIDPFLSELQENYKKNNFDSKDDLLNKLNTSIIELQNSISNFIPHFDLISSNNIDSNSLVLFINSIKKHISNIGSNLYIDSEKTLSHILKTKFSNIKKFFTDYDFKILLKTVQNNIFDLSQFIKDDNVIYLQIIFTEILNDLSFPFNSLYSTDTELSQKLIYYKILKLLQQSFNKLSSDYIFTKQSDFNNKLLWNYVDNSIIKVSSYNNTDSITTLDNKYNNQIYLELFTKIIIHSMNDINIFSNNINDLNNYTNVDFYNEDDLYNSGGSEYENVATFEDDMYPDDMEEQDEDHYYD